VTKESIVLVAGADPTIGTDDHSTCVRAHGHAARRAGLEPHVFCYGPRGALIDADFGTVHRVPLPSGLDHVPGFKDHRYQMVWRAPLLARAVAEFAAGQRWPRLIHSFGVYGWAGALAVRRLQRVGVAATAIVSVHETLARGLGATQRLAFAWKRLVVERFERRGYAESRLILVNYESVRRVLADRYGIGAKVRRLTYAPESAFLHASGTARARSDSRREGTDPPTIVAVSRHDPRRGLDVLVEALARLQECGIGFRACLVGDGPLLAAHRRLVERLGLAERVTVTGFVADPHPYLERADVFVLPSLEEGGGSLSLLEALQVGTAVVASGVDGIPEDVVDGDSALLVGPGDREGLAAALCRVLSDAHLRRRLADRGLATFESRFSAAPFVDAMRETYVGLGVTAGAHSA
jgi:glycosyltransferase involved in cell wall biosynthesis